MFIEAVRIESLGNTTYVIGSEQSGMAAVIDPVRDVDLPGAGSVVPAGGATVAVLIRLPPAPGSIPTVNV